MIIENFKENTENIILETIEENTAKIIMGNL